MASDIYHWVMNNFDVTSHQMERYNNEIPDIFLSELSSDDCLSDDSIFVLSCRCCTACQNEKDGRSSKSRRKQKKKSRKIRLPNGPISELNYSLLKPLAKIKPSITRRSSNSSFGSIDPEILEMLI